MELIYYTIAAIVLYGVSDFILNSIETRMGKRLPNRSFIFLIIITILAMGSFSLIRALFAPLDSDSMPSSTNIQSEQMHKQITTPIQNQVVPDDKKN